MRLDRVVGQDEFADLSSLKRFRSGPNSMEVKWFTDSRAGAIRFQNELYPAGDGIIIGIDVEDELFASAYHVLNLDGSGPATCFELVELEGITPILELGDEYP